MDYMIVEPDSTDVTTYIMLRKTTDGTALTGATITNIDLQYVRTGAAPSMKVDATAPRRCRQRSCRQ